MNFNVNIKYSAFTNQGNIIKPYISRYLIKKIRTLFEQCPKGNVPIGQNVQKETSPLDKTKGGKNAKLDQRTKTSNI